jgi:tetratricopeptide (TPR) repeat protein
MPFPQKLGELFLPRFDNYQQLLADANELVAVNSSLAHVAYTQLTETEAYQFIPESFIALARLHFAKENYTKAADNCNTANKLLPVLFEPNKILASIYARKTVDKLTDIEISMSDLIKHVREIKTDSHQKNYYYHNLLRTTLLVRNKDPELIKLLTVDMLGCDDTPYAKSYEYHFLGWAAYSAHSYEIARYYFERAVEAFPDDFISLGCLVELNWLEAQKVTDRKLKDTRISQSLAQMNYLIEEYNYSRMRLLRGTYYNGKKQTHLSAVDYVEAIKRYHFEEINHFDAKSFIIFSVFEALGRRMFYAHDPAKEGKIKARFVTPHYQQEGDNYFSKKRYSEALFYYSAALWFEDSELESTNEVTSKLYFARAQIYLILGNISEANLNLLYAKKFQKNITSFYENCSLYKLERLVKHVHSGQPKTKFAIYTIYLQAARIYFTTEYSHLAVAILDKAITEFPELSDAHYELGKFYLTINKPELALTQVKKAMEIVPFHREYRKLYVKIKLAINPGVFEDNDSESLILATSRQSVFLEWYQKIVATGQDTASKEIITLCFLGVQAFFDNQYDTCIYMLDQVITEQPQDVVARTYRGLANFILDDPKSAEADFLFGIKQSYPLANLGRGLLNYSNRDYKIANEYLLLAFKSKCYADLDVFEKFENPLIDCISYMDEEFRPESERFYNEGRLKFAKDNFNHARNNFSTAIWMANNDSNAYKYFFFRSFTFLKLGFPDKALKDVTKALELAKKYKTREEDIIILKKYFAKYCLTPMTNLYNQAANALVYISLGISIYPTPALFLKRAKLHEYAGDDIAALDDLAMARHVTYATVNDSYLGTDEDSLDDEIDSTSIFQLDDKKTIQNLPTPVSVTTPEELKVPPASPKKRKKDKKDKKKAPATKSAAAKHRTKVIYREEPAATPAPAQAPVVEIKPQIQPAVSITTPLEEKKSEAIIPTKAKKKPKAQVSKREGRRQAIKKAQAKAAAEQTQRDAEENDASDSETIETTANSTPERTPTPKIAEKVAAPVESTPERTATPRLIEKEVTTPAEASPERTVTPTLTPGEITPRATTPDQAIKIATLVNELIEMVERASLENIPAPTPDSNTPLPASSIVIDTQIDAEELTDWGSAPVKSEGSLALSPVSLTRLSTGNSIHESDTFFTPPSSPSVLPIEATEASATKPEPDKFTVKSTEDFRLEIARAISTRAQAPYGLFPDSLVSPTTTRLNAKANFFQPKAELTAAMLFPLMPKQCEFYEIEKEFIHYVKQREQELAANGITAADGSPCRYDVFIVGGSLTDRIIHAFKKRLQAIPGPSEALLNYLAQPMFSRELILDDDDILTTLPMQEISTIALQMGLIPLLYKGNTDENTHGFSPNIEFLSFIKVVDGIEIKIDFVHKDYIDFDQEAYERDSGLCLDREGHVHDFSGYGFRDLIMGEVRLTIMPTHEYQIELLKILHTIHTSSKRHFNIHDKEIIKQCFWVEQQIQPSYVNSALRKLFFPGRMLENYCKLHEFQIFTILYSPAISHAMLTDHQWITSQLTISDGFSRSSLQHIHAIFIVSYIMQTLLINSNHGFYNTMTAHLTLQIPNIINACYTVINAIPLLSNAFSNSLLLQKILETYINKWKSDKSALIDHYLTPQFAPPAYTSLEQQQHFHQSPPPGFENQPQLPISFAPPPQQTDADLTSHPMERSQTAPPTYSGKNTYRFHVRGRWEQPRAVPGNNQHNEGYNPQNRTQRK